MMFREHLAATGLLDNEGDHLELEEAQGDVPRSLWKSVSAFANTRGGKIYLGVATGASILDLADAPDHPIDPTERYTHLDGDQGMNKLQQAQQLLAELTSAEKAQLLQWVVQDLGDAFPGIEQTPDTLGGDARIVRTRIPVWLLVQARRQGLDDAKILAAYPSLRAEDLANAWAYARTHREEIDHQLSEHEAA